jgi:type VI secretion system secreted protein VgrG
MKRCSIWLVVVSFWAVSAYASTINLLTAGSFAVLGGSTVTNTGFTVLTGYLGLSPGSSITGFPPGTYSGVEHISDAVANQAQIDATNAYGAAAGQAVTGTMTGIDLGGQTLDPGVYFFANSAQLTGILTLDTLGDPNAVFVFQIGSSLTTASASSVVFTDGVNPVLPVANVFWQVKSSATLGSTTDFAGNILALSSITLDTGANITCGRALAQTGAVTMDDNAVSIGGCEVPAGGGGGTPEPGTVPLLGTGLLALILYSWRSRKRVA